MRKIFYDLLDNMDSVDSNATGTVISSRESDSLLPDINSYEYMLAFEAGAAYNRALNKVKNLPQPETEIWNEEIRYALASFPYISDVSYTFNITTGQIFSKQHPEFIYIYNSEFLNIINATYDDVMLPQIFVGLNTQFNSIKDVMKFVKLLSQINNNVNKRYQIVRLYQRNSDRTEFVLKYDIKAKFHPIETFDAYVRKHEDQLKNSFSVIYKICNAFIKNPDTLFNDLKKEFPEHIEYESQQKENLALSLYKNVNKELPNPFHSRRGFVPECRDFIGRKLKKEFKVDQSISRFGASLLTQDGQPVVNGYVIGDLFDIFCSKRPKCIRVVDAETNKAIASNNAAWCGLVFEPIYSEKYNSHFWSYIYIGIIKSIHPEKLLIETLENLFE